MLKGISRRAAPVVLAAGSVVAIAACGSDNNSSTSTSTSATHAKLVAGCAADKKVSDGVNAFFQSTPALQSGKPPTKAQLPQIQANYDKFVAGPLAQVVQNAPAQLKGDVTTAANAVKQLRATGNPQQLGSPAAQKAGANVDGYYFRSCPGQKAAISGVDYAFGGVKQTYAAGATRFQFVNKGKEEHEMLIVKKKPGTTESFDQLLKLPQSQAQAKTVAVGQAEGSPGSTNYVAVNLAKGDYLMLCSIPKGTTATKQGTGPPHFVLGMKQEFTVR
jgi:hypothetical protein